MSLVENGRGLIGVLSQHLVCSNWEKSLNTSG